MPARKLSKPDAKPQSERFIEMARELGCDEDEGAFLEKLGKIARQKLKNQSIPASPQKDHTP